MKSRVSGFHATLLKGMKHADFMQIFHRDYGTYIQALLSFCSLTQKLSNVLSVPMDFIIKITR